MYLTVKEAAEYLSLPEATVEGLVLQRKIRAIYDGEKYLINQDQFSTYFKQLEKYKELVEEIMNEPIPDDLDVKDED